MGKTPEQMGTVATGKGGFPCWMGELPGEMAKPPERMGMVPIGRGKVPERKGDLPVGMGMGPEAMGKTPEQTGTVPCGMGRSPLGIGKSPLDIAKAPIQVWDVPFASKIVAGSPAASPYLRGRRADSCSSGSPSLGAQPGIVAAHREEMRCRRASSAVLAVPMSRAPEGGDRI
jgi:hypothetical protein